MLTSPDKTLLVIDDENANLELVSAACRRDGYTTMGAPDGHTGLRLLYENQPDAVLLDLGVPGLDGWHVLERIRDLTDVPVILMTDHRSCTETVRALHAGADDVVTKPFEFEELLARLTALLRRSANRTAPPIARYADGQVEIDVATRRVVTDGRERQLTPTEFRLLDVLVRHADMVLSPAQLLEQVWHDPVGTGDGSVKIAVLRLRRKLGWEDVTTSPIEAVRGVGYRYRSRPA